MAESLASNCGAVAAKLCCDERLDSRVIADERVVLCAIPPFATRLDRAIGAPVEYPGRYFRAGLSRALPLSASPLVQPADLVRARSALSRPTSAARGRLSRQTRPVTLAPSRSFLNCSALRVLRRGVDTRPCAGSSQSGSFSVRRGRDTPQSITDVRLTDFECNRFGFGAVARATSS